MKEEYLHFLFRFKMLGNKFTAVDGKELEIVDFGQYNTNAGPDFLNGKIKYDEKIWAGSIEFHIKSSDWYLHKHQHDSNYKNVVAHLVYEYDRELQIDSFVVPTVELKSMIDSNHFNRYKNLADSKKKIPCQGQINEIDQFVVFQQKERALTNRLMRKSAIILKDIDRLNGDLEKAFYLSMARIFGGKVNALPFEKLVDQLDLRNLQKERVNELIVSSILFGVSGLLPENSDEKYVQDLIAEFNFQKKKHNLKVMNETEWRFSRMLPHGFPTIRLAQFAALIQTNLPISKLISCDCSINEIKEMLNVEIPIFWNTHYQFKTSTKNKSSNISPDFKELIIINTIIPFLFAVGLLKDNNAQKEVAVNYLSFLKPEKNTISKYWDNLGIKSLSAFDSQALIEQKNEFCSKKKCLFCSVGAKLLKP